MSSGVQGSTITPRTQHECPLGRVHVLSTRTSRAAAQPGYERDRRRLSLWSARQSP